MKTAADWVDTSEHESLCNVWLNQMSPYLLRCANKHNGFSLFILPCSWLHIKMSKKIIVIVKIFCIVSSMHLRAYRCVYLPKHHFSSVYDLYDTIRKLMLSISLKVNFFYIFLIYSLLLCLHENFSILFLCISPWCTWEISALMWNDSFVHMFCAGYFYAHTDQHDHTEEAATEFTSLLWEQFC